jgi:hypothetical protein
MSDYEDTGDADLVAALREAREAVKRLRQGGGPDADLARVAIATFLQHLPPAVFEDIALSGGPINHALARAVEEAGKEQANEPFANAGDR